MSLISAATRLTAVAMAFMPCPALCAESVREALIITNTHYTGLPALPVCARSATPLAAALRARGFAVTVREDASIGAIDGAVGAFSRAQGRTAGFVYVCGHGAVLNDRLFLLPVSTSLARPTDVMTQGVLLKSMMNAIGGGTGVTVIALDLAAGADTPSTAALDALTALPLAGQTGLIIASHGVDGDGATPLARALVAGLDTPSLQAGALLTETRARLAEAKVTTLALRPPDKTGYLAGEPPPSTPPPAPTPEPVVTKPPPPAAPPIAAPPLASRVTSPAVPDEADMTEADRVLVQKTLIRLGYYAKDADGRFGPETRAAIRRYQHEIGVELTGRLTAAQATRLTATR